MWIGNTHRKFLISSHPMKRDHISSYQRRPCAELSRRADLTERFPRFLFDYASRMVSKKTLSAVDYVLFFGSLLLTLLVGMYQAWKGRRDSAEEMVVVSKGLSLPPIVLSLAATYISAIILLGTPAEIYANGSTWWTQIFGYAFGTTLAALIFVPVLHSLRLTSLFSYLEMRFESKLMRWTGTLLYLFGTTLYMGVGLYAPVIAVSSVTDFPEWVGIAVCGSMCTVYTAVGGLKAVVWTDALQIFLMLAGVLAVIIYGVVDVGGFQQVWSIAEQYNRTEFFNYEECDPLKAGLIQKKDEIIPFFVMDKLGHLVGLPGVFLACLFAGALSTLSSGMNSVAAVILETIRQTRFGKHLNAKQTATYTKLIVQSLYCGCSPIATGSGLVTMALAFMAGQLGGGIMQMVVTVTAVTSGPTLALFLTAVLFPFVNKHIPSDQSLFFPWLFLNDGYESELQLPCKFEYEKKYVQGAFAGVIASLAMTSWLGFGSYIMGVPGPIPLDSSVRGCDFNVTIKPPPPSPNLDE
ncbi:unnamed protein product [Darwinula stevensoni]|uniref:Sodium-dependent multivitamin transporter n=1 Tax=Darwinula stevensoni TaxID=69355 RepID=A0A7R8X1A7_9CRUS|nr:unnamed protein product [Darwinula stevensoni]CAG0882592.1 unnamed protein product [Darwinula stevensoni]